MESGWIKKKRFERVHFWGEQKMGWKIFNYKKSSLKHLNFIISISRDAKVEPTKKN